MQFPAEKNWFDEKDNYEERVANYEDIIKRACESTNINLFGKNEHADLVDKFITVIFAIYRVLNLVTFIAAFIGIILAVRKIILTSIKEYYDETLIVVITVSSLMLSAVYALAISWFSQFLINYDENLTFYGIGIIPMLAIFEILGTYLFVRLWKKF